MRNGKQYICHLILSLAICSLLLEMGYFHLVCLTALILLPANTGVVKSARTAVLSIVTFV